MVTKQISIFNENKPGKLYETMQFIAENGIDVKAMSVADSQSYGIIRIIVDEPDQVAELLIKNAYVVKVTSVLSMSVLNEAGMFAKVLKLLAEADINIEYAYAYSEKDEKARFIIRVDEIEKAAAAIEKFGLNI